VAAVPVSDSTAMNAEIRSIGNPLIEGNPEFKYPGIGHKRDLANAANPSCRIEF
jgi:hypothetical protein